MNPKALSIIRLLLVAVMAATLLFVGAAFATAQENGELYPLPEETPVTGVLGDVVVDAEAPVTAVLPSDLARTGFGLGAPLALASLLVLVGGSIVIADRRYRRRQERSIAA